MTHKKFIPIVIVIAVAALIWWSGKEDSSEQESPQNRGGGGQAVAVETGEIARQTIQDIAEYTGTLEAARRFNLAPKVGGRIRSLEVDIGDQVRQGQVIARLDAEEFEQEVAEARAALEVAKAQLEDAKAREVVREREFRRLEDLRNQGLVSESEYDVGESEYQAARANALVNRAQVAQREAALGAAELRRSHTTIRAEWNGAGDGDARYVGRRFVDEGANISANESIISVLDTSSLKAVTQIVDRDFARLQTGQNVTIRSDAWPGEVFSGSVARISPQLEEDTRQARIEVHVPNPERRLSPGFFVNLSINIEEIEDALVVPLDAVTRHGGQRGIFLVKEAETEDERPSAQFTPVTLGVETGSYAQILEPSDLDGRVVTLGQHRLGDGTPLRITDNASR